MTLSDKAALDDSLSLRLAQRSSLEPLRDAHFDSVDAFHHKDGNRSRQKDLNGPRRVSDLASGRLAIRGFHPTTAAFMSFLTSDNRENDHNRDREQIGTISTTAVLMSILENPKLPYVNLILDDLLLELFRRFTENTLGPLDLHRPNPLTSAELLEVLSRLLPVLEQSGLQLAESAPYSCCLRKRADELGRRAIAEWLIAVNANDQETASAMLAPTWAVIANLIAIGILRERSKRLDLVISMLENNTDRHDLRDAVLAALRLRARNLTILDIINHVSPNSEFEVFAAVLRQSVQTSDDVLPELLSGVSAMQEEDTGQFGSIKGAIQTDLRGLMAELTRQQQLRDAQAIERCQCSEGRLHNMRELTEAPYLAGWVMVHCLLGWLATHVITGRGVVVSSLDPLSRDSVHEATGRKGSTYYQDHGYLVYWALRGLRQGASVLRREGAKGYDDLLRSVDEASAILLQASRGRLFEQVARLAAHDQDADPFEVGFHLAALESFDDHRLSSEILLAALEHFFAAQTPEGIFERTNPVWVSSYGEFHCTTFEVLRALLDAFRGLGGVLAPWSDRFALAAAWLQRNAIRPRTPRAPESGGGGVTSTMWWGFTVRAGYVSPSVADVTVLAEQGAATAAARGAAVSASEVPSARSTGTAYTFVHVLYKALSSEINGLIIRRLTGSSSVRVGPPEPLSFARAQGLVEVGGAKVRLAEILRHDVCEPLRINAVDRETFSLSAFANPTRLIRSGVLFGPPGTGKTTFARATATFLGWPFLELDPSHFAADGLDRVPERVTSIFRYLMELDNTVIIFDEMDELVRSRDHSGTDTSWIQRLWTTSFLPKLQKLHENAKVVFFIATNSFMALDDAIVRAGRFDFATFVPVPSFPDKMEIVRGPRTWADRELRWKECLERVAQSSGVVLEVDNLAADGGQKTGKDGVKRWQRERVAPEQFLDYLSRSDFLGVWDQLCQQDPGTEEEQDRIAVELLRKMRPKRYPDLKEDNRFPLVIIDRCERRANQT